MNDGDTFAANIGEPLRRPELGPQTTRVAAEEQQSDHLAADLNTMQEELAAIEAKLTAAKEEAAIEEASLSPSAQYNEHTP